MAQYYVNKTGNDGNDGSNPVDQGGGVGPWLTCGFAVDTMIGSHVEADVLTVGDGTYIEIVGGGDYWYITEDFTSGGLVIEAQNSGSVTIGGGTDALNSVFLATASFITFDGINFTYGANNSSNVVVIENMCRSIRFLNCTFSDSGRTGSDKFIVRMTCSGASSMVDTLFYNCTLTLTSASTGTTSKAATHAIKFNDTDDGGQAFANRFSFVDCTINITGNHAGFLHANESINGLMLDNCTLVQTSGTAGTRAFDIGEDGAANLKLCAGPVVQNCTFTFTTTNHGVLFGAGVYGGVFRNNIVNGSSCNFVLVLKVNPGTQVLDNIVIGGTSETFISRGSSNCVIKNNIFYGGLIAAHLDQISTFDGELGTFTNNILYPINTGGDAKCLYVDDVDIKNWYVDYNCYWGESSGTVYPMFSDGANKTWEQLNTWWGTYGTEVGRIFNDDNSVNADPLFVDAANGDFRLLSGSSGLNTGKNTLSIGVWQQKQRGSLLGAMNV